MLCAGPLPGLGWSTSNPAGLCLRKVGTTFSEGNCSTTKVWRGWITITICLENRSGDDPHPVLLFLLSKRERAEGTLTLGIGLWCLSSARLSLGAGLLPPCKARAQVHLIIQSAASSALTVQGVNFMACLIPEVSNLTGIDGIFAVPKA